MSQSSKPQPAQPGLLCCARVLACIEESGGLILKVVGFDQTPLKHLSNMSHRRTSGATPGIGDRETIALPPVTVGERHGATSNSTITYGDHRPASVLRGAGRTTILGEANSGFDNFQLPFRFNPGTNWGNVEMGLKNKSYLMTLNQRVPGSSPWRAHHCNQSLGRSALNLI